MPYSHGTTPQRSPTPRTTSFFGNSLEQREETMSLTKATDPLRTPKTVTRTRFVGHPSIAISSASRRAIHSLFETDSRCAPAASPQLFSDAIHAHVDPSPPKSSRIVDDGAFRKWRDALERSAVAVRAQIAAEHSATSQIMSARRRLIQAKVRTTWEEHGGADAHERLRTATRLLDEHTQMTHEVRSHPGRFAKTCVVCWPCLVICM